MKIAATLSLAIGMSLTSFAQAAVPDMDHVVRTCGIVSINEIDGQTGPTRGTCFAAAAEFLQGISGAADANEQVLGLIDELAFLVVMDTACGDLEDEVARAIALAQGYVTSDEARAQLVSYGQSVEECGISLTSPSASPS